MEPARPRSSGSLAPRRVFTAPAPPSIPQPATSPQAASGLVDTLYDHPNVKIISFTAGASSLFVGQRTGDGPDIEPGSLSWSSQLERTIAVGPFRIYRAPGSVAFLSCGSALQPILPKSQVWCVDEESSKFVLQIRRPQYWRIEVPIGDDQEVRLAQQLREVFDAILQFEKTECPFSRPFTVELPEQTPVTRRPWTARRSSESLSLTPVTPEIARLHEGTPRGSICIGDLRTVGETRRALSEHARSLVARRERSAIRGSVPAVNGQDNDRASTSLFPPRAERPRSVSAAPPRRRSFIGGSLPKIREAAPPADPTAKPPRFTSPTESLESIHGRESWLPTPLPPSPPLSTPGSPRSSSQQFLAHVPQFQTQHIPAIADTPQDALDQSVTSKPSHAGSVASTNSLPESDFSATTTPSSIHSPDRPPITTQPQPASTPQQAPTPTKTGPETPFKTPASSPAPTSPSPSPRARRPPLRRATTTSSSLSLSSSSPRQALSPLPPAANLLTTRRQPPRPPPPPPPTAPVMQGALAAVRRLPMTVLHKTCEILFSPPSHLIALMLRVAARIMAGEWRGLVFGLGEGGERVSVTWDWSDDDDGLGGARRGGVGFGGWATRFGGADRADDFWLRGRTGPGRAKMVGAFPDSDDEDEDEGVGPLDRSGLGSPGRKRGSVASPRAGLEQGAGGGKGDGKPGKESDSESGVD
ncbi:inheritance of peroxisomes protein 1-domain-containing protein [Chaetomium sp. MPI-CAGE-AT-0009]|nr:inheritance of peroxisomes protein 1-domain-containing protein [Chaetomium sp. MPI-CAGE-AT-0009]